MTEFADQHHPNQQSLVERLQAIDPADTTAMRREIDLENWSYHIEHVGPGNLTPEEQFDRLTPEQQAAYIDVGMTALLAGPHGGAQAV